MIVSRETFEKKHLVFSCLCGIIAINPFGEKGGFMTKIISLSNQKGGVGKTTTAVNVAAAMGLLGKKTLIIDLDPQGNTTSGLGFDKRSVKQSTYDVLDGDATPEEITKKTDFDNLSLMPSNINLAGLDARINLFSGKEARLKNKISNFKNNYDYIFIDCPPSLGIVTINALCASDSVLVPIQGEYFALEGLSQLMNTIKIIKRHHNADLDIEGILMTMFDSRLNLTKQVMEEVKKNFPNKVFETVIPRTVRISEATSFGKPVVHFDKSNKGSLAYINLAKEILE